jgi:hypothetical protein
MTDQTVEETKDAGSDEAQVEQTEQAVQPEGDSSLKDKVEDVVDSVKDKLTGGDKDSADDKDDAKE